MVRGKTTSALGRCFFEWQNGKKVMVLQFIKGDRSYGEMKLQNKMAPSFEIKQGGMGFVRNSGQADLEQHRKQALSTLDEALSIIKSNKYDIVVLDELNYAVHFNLLTENQVLGVIDQKPDNTVLIITGRYARESIIERSDEVYEFKDIKHYSTSGIMAREGIEF